MIEMLAAVLVMALATQFTRGFPFLLFSSRRPPENLIRSARLIPGAVMVVLVFTSLPVQKNILAPEMWIPWGCVLITALLHLRFRHPLVSIIGGTALYMTLIHFIGS